MSKAQISMWEEKIVDSFAGGGGLWSAHNTKAVFSDRKM